MSLEHFVVLVVDADDHRVFERSDEVSGGFASVEVAEKYITAFLSSADEAGFSYSRDDFVIQRIKP